MFDDDYDGYVNFRHRLVESVISKCHAMLFDVPKKTYLTVLDKLMEINEIYVEGRMTMLTILCHKAVYLSRTKNQFRAEFLVDEIKKDLQQNSDSFLKVLVKYAIGHIAMNQNRIDDAIVSFIYVISELFNTIQEDKTKKRYQLLYCSAIYWLSKCHHLKKQYQDAAKYSKKLISTIETNPESESDGELQSYHRAATCMLADIDDRFNKKYAIEHVVRNDAVDPYTGIKLQNVVGYRFYNPVTTVKALDEFWPENDKQSSQIKAIGKSLYSTKLSPYKEHVNKHQKLVDLRHKPLIKESHISHLESKSNKKQGLPCSPPAKVDSHLNDHLVTVGALTSELRLLNSTLTR